jgi:hypothetical protein
MVVMRVERGAADWVEYSVELKAGSKVDTMGLPMVEYLVVVSVVNLAYYLVGSSAVDSAELSVMHLVVSWVALLVPKRVGVMAALRVVWKVVNWAELMAEH